MDILTKVLQKIREVRLIRSKEILLEHLEVQDYIEILHPSEAQPSIKPLLVLQKLANKTIEELML